MDKYRTSTPIQNYMVSPLPPYSNGTIVYTNSRQNPSKYFGTSTRSSD